MSQSLAKIYLHTVFSTKNRQPFLADIGLRHEMHAYLGGIAKELNCQPIRIGGVENHVHLLTNLPRNLTIADFVKEIKRASSLWMHRQKEKTFQWQAGYGVFSVSQSQIEQVTAYVEQQEKHHARYDFQTEFRELLRRHRIEFDERYVWD